MLCKKIHYDATSHTQKNQAAESHTGTQVPTRISAPAAARAFAIAQPQPLSSATPAINALLPWVKSYQVDSALIENLFDKLQAALEEIRLEMNM